jgi:flagellar hook assembly protein FlgD
MWSFEVGESSGQTGGVGIVSNVIDPRRGETTRVTYRLDSRGSVTVMVSDLKGDLVDVLFRGTQGVGEHSLSWDGRNRGGRIVAPGLYYIKVLAPGISEIRKVLVVRN